jgi:hypothetical protein
LRYCQLAESSAFRFSGVPFPSKSHQKNPPSYIDPFVSVHRGFVIRDTDPNQEGEEYDRSKDAGESRLQTRNILLG